MSSAYSAALTPLGDSDTRSLMNNRKRVGDRKSHWGTPWRRKIFLLLSWSRLICARLLNRCDWIHLRMLLATPFLISLTMSPSIHTLSNERCRSIQATRVTLFSWNASSISCLRSDLQSHGTAESQLVLVPKGRWSPGTTWPLSP